MSRSVIHYCQVRAEAGTRQAQDGKGLQALEGQGPRGTVANCRGRRVQASLRGFALTAVPIYLVVRWSAAGRVSDLPCQPDVS